jgi:hypothetical protein
MRGGEKDAVAFAQQEPGFHAGHGGVRMKEPARDVSVLQRRELTRGRRLREFEPDAGVVLVKFAEDFRQDGGHGEAGEGHAEMSNLSAGERGKIRRNRGQTAQQRFDPLQQHPASGSEFQRHAGVRLSRSASSAVLELGNGAAERWLCDCERLGRLPKMQEAGDLAKVNRWRSSTRTDTHSASQEAK